LKFEELETQYNKLSEKYILMKNNCQKYFEIIDNKQFILKNSNTDVSRIEFAGSLLNDKNTAKKYQKLNEAYSI